MDAKAERCNIFKNDFELDPKSYTHEEACTIVQHQSNKQHGMMLCAYYPFHCINLEFTNDLLLPE